jgi:chromosome segregation ATPase
MMPNVLLLQWSLWSFALLAGVGAIIVLFKLRIAERFLPPWNELKGLEATLPVRREELRQVSDALQSQHQQLATLEGEVGHLHQLREWQQVNPDAPARIQQMMVDLERGKSELAAVQQKLAQDEARCIEIAQEVQRATQENTQLAEQIPRLHDQLDGLQRQKGEVENNLRTLEDQHRQLDFKIANLKDSVQAHEHDLSTLRQQLDTIAREKAAAIAERDQVSIARDAAKADLGLTTRRLEAARDELKQLEEKTEGLGQQRRRLDDAVDLLTQQRDSLTGDCRAAEAELEKTRAQLDQAEREKRAAITERDQARTERDALKDPSKPSRRLPKGKGPTLQEHRLSPVVIMLTSSLRYYSPNSVLCAAVRTNAKPLNAPVITFVARALSSLSAYSTPSIPRLRPATSRRS